MLTLPETYAAIGLVLDADKDGGRHLYDKDGNLLVESFNENDIINGCYIYGMGYKAGVSDGAK